MPICKQIQINSRCGLYVWKITESLEELLQLVCLLTADEQKLDNFGSESRKKEFLATRALVQKIMGADVGVENDENGKPGLINSKLEISITHTKTYVGILLGEGHELALDMECLTDRVSRIANRFLSEEELKHISNSERLLHLYQHWCAKECLIKLYGKKDVDLITELKIDPFSPADESFTGQVCCPDFWGTYIFRHLRIGDHLLVYCCQKHLV